MANINNLSLSPDGYCVFCSTKTNLVCHRCGDFYCTKICQLKDWPSHRYICFSIPALVRPKGCSVFSNINSTYALISSDAAAPSSLAAANAQSAQKSNIELATNGTVSECDKSKINRNTVMNNTSATQPPIPIGDNKNNNNSSSNNITSKEIPFKPTYAHVAMPLNNSIVYVTGFRWPNRCFIRDASETAEKAHLEICQKVNLLGKNQPKLKKLIPGGLALAKYNGLFQRVKIVGKPYSTSRLHFIDLGMMNASNIAEMREISSELLELPCHNLEVQIKDVSNNKLTEHINNFLKHFDGKKFILTNINGWNVELLHVETHKSMNEQIRDFCSNAQAYSTHSTKPTQHTKNNPDPKRAADVTEISVDPYLNSAEHKPEMIMDRTTVANHAQIAKTERMSEVIEIKLDKESIRSETKPKASVPFNNSNKIKSEIANLQLMLKKAKHEQIAKTENISNANEIKLDKESRSSEITNLQLMLKKDQTTVASNEQTSKTQNIADANKIKLDKESISSEITNLQKDQTTVASNEQTSKTENIADANEIKLDKQLISSETKPKASVPFNNSIKSKSEIENLQLLLTKAKHEQIAKTENISNANEIKLDKESRSSEITNLQLMLKKDQTTVASNEQTSKTGNIADANKIKLDNESISSESKPKANGLLNLGAIETIPTSVLAREATSRVQAETKKSPAKAFVSMPPVTPIIVSEPKIPTNNTTKPDVEPVLIPPFEFKRLTSQSNGGLDIFIVDNANVSRGIFGSFDSNNARDFSDLHSRLSEFKDSQPYRPMIREYVIAKFEDVWYRARVIRIIQNQLDCTYNVMFLDFTNVAFVTEQDIRRYPADLTVPCFTSVCLIEDMPHRPTTDQINFLEKKLQMNSLLHIDSVNYRPHTDIALIKCDSLIEGLAKMM
ncbi:uncharacterized protein LOC6568117 isoform X2 [Drosophila grimshawi]|uniref:uncharacterized protein LOC6568117 isoform X2 n=1 Tax=Drosophila grimshawi TaxID=7222 RepID=UPI001C933945|nr:uncharacterized protein LOC6568117 isoform X2 [Drosophila grimshawi]